MRRIRRPVLALVVATLGLPLAPLAWAGPPNPTASDLGLNTAGGTQALGSNAYDPSTGDGSVNTAFGALALTANTIGAANTATGVLALSANVSGDHNTADGAYALQTNTGSDNTAVGAGALSANTSGSANTATGNLALTGNVGGSNNTADGVSALGANTIGGANSALGANALTTNTLGSNNTAAGAYALLSNTAGDLNTAAGVQALFGNTTGQSNTGLGVDTLLGNDTGSGNTAVGAEALANAVGSNNVAIGSKAGASLVSGSKNVYIGNKGKAAESQTIRIGQNQARTFIAGVAGTPVSGSTVLVNARGQLGVLVSSARYKADIAEMGDASRRLAELRPVTFRYRADASRERQYGLVAEEVAGVYPELVVRAAGGAVQSVKYEELIPMLLNELQREQRDLAAQTQQLSRLRAENDALRASLTEQRARDAAFAARLDRLEEAARATTVASR